VTRTPHELIGSTPVALTLEEDIRLAARSDAKVLITGESGVGKEVAAQRVHQQSARASFPMVTINCAGVPDTLLESEFFGHERGSFTGAYRDRQGFLENADRGTVFLDEIGEMSLRLQGLLLRFLETGEIQRVGGGVADRRVNVRVIAASNRSLEAEVEKKNFRDDLFYRLNVIRLHVPPLRERLADVPLLVRHFLDQFSAQYRVPRIEVTAEAMAIFTAYAWPGNVRELRNIVERTIVRLKGHLISAADLPVELRRSGVVATPSEVVAVRPNPVDELFARMVEGREPFWSAVYEPFMMRDLTRDQVRDLVTRGLEACDGDYKALGTLFNVPGADQKRFVGLLRRYECYVTLQRMRGTMMKVSAMRARELDATGGVPPRYGTDS
jgi:transcriptional regulator with PAS, ATPase and Fis domain